MSDPEQSIVAALGAEEWNRWRERHPSVLPDLRLADLSRAQLQGANLAHAKLAGANLEHALISHADLTGADLSDSKLSFANLAGAKLVEANLQDAQMAQAMIREADFTRASLRESFLTMSDATGCNFHEADLYHTQCSGVDFCGALLSKANLSQAVLDDANFTKANLAGANLTYAYLSGARLIQTNLEDADLTGANVYGVSVWDANLDRAIQKDLVITFMFSGGPDLTVDNLEVAQFVYLLLANSRMRNIIDTITSKVVLILGRFTAERKTVLDAIREELRKYNYLPVLFDFEQPRNRDLAETVSTLAHIARFVIADLSEPRSIPQELMNTVPHLPSVPVQPLLLAEETEWGLYQHLASYPWVLPIVRYRDLPTLIAQLKDDVIDPAEAKARELVGKRLQQNS